MAITTFDNYISRISSNFEVICHFYVDIQTATVAVTGGVNLPMQASGRITLPSPLPTGVTSYIPSSVTAISSSTGIACLATKLVNMGSIDISGASGTFTPGSAMPTATELGASNQIWGQLIMEVTAATNATPGTLTVTYKDQDGNAAEAAPAFSIGASAPIYSASMLGLNTGDYGVTEVTNAVRSAGTTPSGTIQFWGTSQPIALFQIPTGLVGFVDLLTSNFNPQRFVAGDVIGFFTFSSNATKSNFGMIKFIGE